MYGWNALLASVTTALLVGCGGGGGGQASSPTTFAFQAGYRQMVSTGGAHSLAVSGDCAGSAVISASPTAAATFEAVDGFAADSAQTISLSGCSPTSISGSATAYYDSNFLPLGADSAGIEYSKISAPANPLPTSVQVGDTATYARLTVYTDSSKATTTGSRELSYVIEAGSDSTAIANLVTKSFDASDRLLFTQQTRYRMATDGTLTLLSIDLQFSTTSTLHLLMTKT